MADWVNITTLPGFAVHGADEGGHPWDVSVVDGNIQVNRVVLSGFYGGFITFTFAAGTTIAQIRYTFAGGATAYPNPDNVSFLDPGCMDTTGYYIGNYDGASGAPTGRTDEACATAPFIRLYSGGLYNTVIDVNLLFFVEVIAALPQSYAYLIKDTDRYFDPGQDGQAFLPASHACTPVVENPPGGGGTPPPGGGSNPPGNGDTTTIVCTTVDMPPDFSGNPQQGCLCIVTTANGSTGTVTPGACS